MTLNKLKIFPRKEHLFCYNIFVAYKELLGLIAIVIAFISYVPYFFDILSGKTKPHVFSWLIWGIIVGLAFFGQITDNGGPGTWATGFTALACFAIFLLAFQKGEKDIVLIDWISLIGAFVAIIFWVITKGPLLSVILLSIIDTLGFVPTFRKSYMHPHNETLSTYIMSVIKFILSLFALENFSLITAFFPTTLVLANGAFVAMLIIRRNQLAKKS